jgi:hypothetical protein
MEHRIIEEVVPGFDPDVSYYKETNKLIIQNELLLKSYSNLQADINELKLKLANLQRVRRKQRTRTGSKKASRLVCSFKGCLMEFDDKELLESPKKSRHT